MLLLRISGTRSPPAWGLWHWDARWDWRAFGIIDPHPLGLDRPQLISAELEKGLLGLCRSGPVAEAPGSRLQGTTAAQAPRRGGPTGGGSAHPSQGSPARHEPCQPIQEVVADVSSKGPEKSKLAKYKMTIFKCCHLIGKKLKTL